MPYHRPLTARPEIHACREWFRARNQTPGQSSRGTRYYRASAREGSSTAFEEERTDGVAIAVDRDLAPKTRPPRAR